MPEVKGTEFLREAALRCPSTFRVLLTGTIGVGEVLAEVGAGVVHIFLSKPWNEAEMRGALGRAEAYLDASPKPRRRRKG
jgi:FixJ family two-component response regulator